MKKLSVAVVAAGILLSISGHSRADTTNYKVVVPKLRYQNTLQSEPRGGREFTRLNPSQGYWGNSRSRSIRPAPMPTLLPKATAKSTQGRQGSAKDPVVLVPGWAPQDKKSSKIYKRVELRSDSPARVLPTIEQQAIQQQAYAYGAGPVSSTDYAGYAKFQRNALQGKYLSYPRSIVGKLFFSDGVNIGECSATVVGRSMIFTAGHCVSSGDGLLYQSFLFCPSYKEDSTLPNGNAAIGCWTATGVAVTDDYKTYSSMDRDYACLVLSPTGNVRNNYVGDLTGWAGMAYNFPASEMVYSIGYPAVTPFAGKNIYTSQGPVWYTIDTDPSDWAPNVSSMYMGNDMTPGSSGGPWLINWDVGAALGDTDGSSVTDPLQGFTRPFLVGVNSHRRTGYLSEMGSPQFASDSAAPTNLASDAEDIWNLCASNGGNP